MCNLVCSDLDHQFSFDCTAACDYAGLFDSRLDGAPQTDVHQIC